MSRHTTDPVEQAADIAEGEAERAWSRFGPGSDYFRIWCDTYEQVLFEQQDQSLTPERNETWLLDQ